jgi:polysaccharide biosynthesis/export protein
MIFSPLLLARFSRSPVFSRALLGLVFTPIVLTGLLPGTSAQANPQPVPLLPSSAFPSVDFSFRLDDTYTLGAGDQIKIEVANVPEITGEFAVSTDGILDLPWLGELSVQGLTIRETKNLLVSQYSQFLTRPPILTLTLVAPRPIRIAVSGEVNRPGTYVTETNVEQNVKRFQLPTVTELIQKAGGITQTADIRQVRVLRAPRADRLQAINVNLWDLVTTGDITQDVSLRDGDTVVVPRANTVDPSEAVRLGRVNFAPDKINVQVVGEVVAPGAVTLQPNTSLNQAILAAGGFKNDRARASEVEFIRLNLDGTVVRRTIEVDFAAQPNDVTNPLLQNNDVVVARRSEVGAISDIFNSVVTPLSGAAGILRLLFGF